MKLKLRIMMAVGYRRPKQPKTNIPRMDPAHPPQKGGHYLPTNCPESGHPQSAGAHYMPTLCAVSGHLSQNGCFPMQPLCSRLTGMVSWRPPDQWLCHRTAGIILPNHRGDNQDRKELRRTVLRHTTTPMRSKALFFWDLRW